MDGGPVAGHRTECLEGRERSESVGYSREPKDQGWGGNTGVRPVASRGPRVQSQRVCALPLWLLSTVIRTTAQEFCAAVLSQKALAATGDSLITTSWSDRGLLGQTEVILSILKGF